MLSAARFLAVLIALVTLGACTISPVHQTYSGVRMELARGDTDSRLEQVAYQTIFRRVSETSNPQAPVLDVVSATVSGSQVGQTSHSGNSVRTMQIVARLTVHVLDINGEPLFTETRTATSQYRVVYGGGQAQVLTNDTARQNAEEEAIRAAAESMVHQLLAWGYHWDAHRLSRP